MEDQLKTLWQAVLGELELMLSKASFTTWLKNTFIIEKKDGRVVIGVPTTFAQVWLKTKYHHYIYKIIQDKTNERIKEIIYKVQTLKNYQQQLIDIKTQNKQNQPSINYNKTTVSIDPTVYSSEKTFSPISGLNSKYTFDNFIIGKGNELATAAARAVVEKPGETYNPLFIYGGVGLGKTHLIQAIGNELHKRNPNLKIIYVTCEHFTNDFISAIQSGHPEKFTNHYRTCDLLMIDDIQFLSGKEGTQDAFFHTFNELHVQKKQIVITSDRPPKAIATLEERLQSRMEWGMIADISKPDMETRIAILEAKIKERGFYLPREIVQFITLNIQNNIRELEGALNKIIAYYQLNKMEPTLENVKKILFSISDSSRKNDSVTLKRIIEVTSEFYGINPNDLLGKSREKRLAFPRQIIMFLLREELGYSYPTIGAEMGGRDHTTAMHAYTKINQYLSTNEKIRQEINLLKQKIYSC